MALDRPAAGERLVQRVLVVRLKLGAHRNPLLTIFIVYKTSPCSPVDSNCVLLLAVRKQ